MRSNSKTQQVIATSSADSSTIADAIHLKQLITELENNIGVSTFDFDKHQPNIVCSAILLLQQAWSNEWGSTKEQNIYNFAFCGFRICIKLGNWFFVVFQQKTTQQMLSPKHFQLLIFNDIFPQLACKQMLPTKRGNTTTSSLSLTTSRSRSNFKQLFVNNCAHNKLLKLHNWVDNCNLQQQLVIDSSAADSSLASYN